MCKHFDRNWTDNNFYKTIHAKNMSRNSDRNKFHTKLNNIYVLRSHFFSPKQSLEYNFPAVDKHREKVSKIHAEVFCQKGHYLVRKTPKLTYFWYISHKCALPT